ncbi:MAG TPA: carbamoyltransferase N-terminal domain-containing protein [Puia sp.]|jgi:carbamoyltransferase|nr:carbamoyltransferase N-terminal domain-containing protein [Puia sp.]
MRQMRREGGLILGISAFFHDSAAAIILDGKVIAAAQEERFTRVKHDAGFPARAVEYCLEAAGATVDELDAVVFYDKPLLKLERILESYHSTAPRGWGAFLRWMPVWMKQKMMLKKVIRDELEALGSSDRRKPRLLFSEHHLSHAASAFYPSPFDEAAILTVDGVGEWATTSIGVGRGKDIRFLREIRYPHSLGLLYSAFTYYCGFRVNSGEYKLMGLAPYGNEDSERFRSFREKITTRLIRIYEDGSFFLHQEFFDYLPGLRMARDRKWEQLFGLPRRKPESEIDQAYCDLALAIQRVTEDVILRLATTARRLTGCERIVLAGGVALNCVANGKLAASGLFAAVFIQPAAGDAGGALGAAMAAYHIYFGRERVVAGMEHVDLGPAYPAERIAKVCSANGLIGKRCDSEDELARVVAGALGEGLIVGWFRGRMEFGPRALGHRSILADPRRVDMQRRLNLSIKYREDFRPFAPVCREERAADYIEGGMISPFMLLIGRLQERWYCPLPEGYAGLQMREKLAVVRSRFPAITHVDGTARWQTVSKRANPELWKLLEAFEVSTGDGVLINTSMNVRGEPIVCTPEEAVACLMGTGMDVLVLENVVIFKKDQAPAAEWKKEGAMAPD